MCGLTTDRGERFQKPKPLSVGIFVQGVNESPNIWRYGHLNSQKRVEVVSESATVRRWEHGEILC